MVVPFIKSVANMELAAAILDPYQNVGIYLLAVLLTYRRQLGRRPRRFFASPIYGHYHRLMRELELAEVYGNDYSQ